MEAGTIFARHHCSELGQPPKRPPRLRFNGGGRLKGTASVNCTLSEAVGSVNKLMETVNVAQPSLLIAINRGGRLTATTSVVLLTEAAVVKQPPPLIDD